MITKADSSKRLRGYNGLMHFTISLICLLAGYLLVRQQLSIYSAAACAIMAGMLPTMGLKILESINISKISRESMNFFATFSNYASTGFDIFAAFRHSEPELNDPFRSIIRDMLRKYDDKVDPILCLQAAADAIESEEVKSFFRTLIYQLVEGGDYVKLTNELTSELGELVDIDEKENTEDNVLRYGLYLLVGLDLLIIISFLRSNQSYLVIGTLYGEVALTVNFLLAIFLIAASFIKPRR